MEKTQRYTEAEFHQKMAVDLFNFVWSLIEKPERTPDDDTMIHAAHASRYHWGRVGQPVHRARGEWQIARVYTLLNRSEPALYHARRCLAICEAEGIGDWDIAFAHEAVARASASAGDRTAFERHFRWAQELGEKIAEEEDRALLFHDLDAAPWFGMRSDKD